MSYFTMLSKAQRCWLIGTLLIAVLIIALGWIMEPGREDATIFSPTVDMSIRDIAPELDVTGKALARELGLPVDVPKKKSLRKLGVSQADLDHASAHLLSHRPTKLKYYIFTAIVLWGLVFLVRLGRPDGSLVS
ncbi:MAG: hypothetical protein JXM70_16195, partial [Pirellulales bacterium]|nr:hypothetical protein [Pirellulales bacterium]